MLVHVIESSVWGVMFGAVVEVCHGSAALSSEDGVVPSRIAMAALLDYLPECLLANPVWTILSRNNINRSLKSIM